MLEEIPSLLEEYSQLLENRTIVACLAHMKWLGAFMCIAPIQQHMVGATTTEREGYRYVSRYRPDFLIVSDVLEEGSGLSLVRRAEAFHPAIRTVLVIEDYAEELIHEALLAGCDGICLQSEPFTPAFRVVARGGVYYPRQVGTVLRSRTLRSGGPVPVDPLSPRECQILEQVMLGYSNRQIAERLQLSSETVKTHVAHIFTKLEARDRAHASVLGIAHGFVSLEQALEGRMLV